MPSARPRAPTITVDTAAPTDIEIVSPVEDPNSLTVSGLRDRGDSVSTAGSTVIGSPHPSTARSLTISDEDVWKPESDFEKNLFDVQDNPYGLTPGHLSKLLPRKNFAALHRLQGPDGLAKALHTDLESGLPKKDDLETRRRIFGSNDMPKQPPKTLLQLIWLAMQDKILILLSIAAIVSLAFGIYTSITKPAGEGARIDWIEGVAILIAVLMVVSAGSLVDFQKEKQFAKLSEEGKKHNVRVTRWGEIQYIDSTELLPGDIVHIDGGGIIPCDGIYISGTSLVIDESQATGESRLVRKTPASEHFNAYYNGKEAFKMEPFLLSGSKVAEGYGTLLATAVGQNSSEGQLMKSLHEDTPSTPLQQRLDKLAGMVSLDTCLIFCVVFNALTTYQEELPNSD
jgi:P-type Ca2+ transporter type 2C